MKLTEAKLKIAVYRESKQFVAYCPALDISTAGDTLEEAKKNFEELVRIFIDETIKMGTLDDVLLECGWKKVKKPRLHWKPPVRDFITEIEEKVSLPCPA